MNEFFKNAIPVWLNGRIEEMNVRMQAKAIIYFEAQETVIKIATSGIYQLWVNGHFVSYGPARAGKNHFRVDEWDITQYLSRKKNIVVVEVCGYYTHSFYIQKQQSFLTAEIFESGESIAWTGKHFTARPNPFYIQKTERYSYQRPMIEAYKIEKADTFFIDEESGEELQETISGTYIKRHSPYPEFETVTAQRILTGDVENFEPENIIYDRSVTDVNDNLSGFPIDTLESFASYECQKLKSISHNSVHIGAIKNMEYAIYELPKNSTGILSFDISVENDSIIYILFDEVLNENNVVDFLRGGCANCVKYKLSSGKKKLHFFEVYTMKYIQIIAVGGDCDISELKMIEYKHPLIEYNTEKFPPDIKKIADAAIETYRQNSVDIFTDCPSRERAGWLCDSFFSGRTEFLLTGKNIIEKSFLENFLHEKVFQGLPKGMVPMCYPSDRLNDTFIPQWALWLILELEEYQNRSGDIALVKEFEEVVNRLLDYFSAFENSDGLLEKLDGWNFVEWSKANDLVNDVNYPTNMLYAAALEVVSRLYSRSDLLEKGEKIKEMILKQSFNGEFFCDNAVRKKGKLVLTGECTEVCQYYAFFFGVATKSSHAKLLNILINDFGPQRATTQLHPNIYPANAFIGNYLRLEILMRYGEYDKVKDNIIGFFSYMADKTGTLWEHIDTTASCNHGFASYVLCWINEMIKKGN